MNMMSKIKKLFPDELLKQIAVNCDTMRINSAQHKMVIVQQLLKRNNIFFSVLGGATNRVSLYIDGYAIKIAVDNQGYVDNLMEYALSQELQPTVTKSYETNGYILVAEAVKTMSLDEFKLHQSDILAVLSMLSQDYLLGDVGFLAKNYTNWGIRDDGSVVILDYAYIHRGTEKLFTCEVCGCGILRYDPTYSVLECSNKASCNAKFTYIERKAIQGDKVDHDMIAEKEESSIKLVKGVSKITVSNLDGQLVKGKKVVTSSFAEYEKYLQEVANKMNDYDQERGFDVLAKMLTAKSKDEKQELANKLENIYEESKDDSSTEVEYVPVNNPSVDELDTDETEDEEVLKDNYEVTDDCYSLDDLINIASSKNEPVEKPTPDEYAINPPKTKEEIEQSMKPVVSGEDQSLEEVNESGVVYNGDKL